jgi:hypothetical protein
VDAKHSGEFMKRLMLLIFMLTAMAVLTHGQPMTQLSGSDGMALLKSMANVSSNLTEMNNSTINLSRIPTSVQVGGNDSIEQWENMTYDAQNSSGNATGNLSTWGSQPKAPPPLPSKADMDRARIAGILKINHGIV